MTLDTSINDISTTIASVNQPPSQKKRRVERRNKLRKTALCKHFDKPGGCPYPDCKFAHGREDTLDGGMATLAAQRQLIREQAITRAKAPYQDKTIDKESMKTSVKPLPMIERYYTEMYSCDMMKKENEDVYVHMHSNRLCVLGVASSHPVFQKKISTITFTDKVLDSKVSGKKKHGGVFIVPEMPLCYITTEDDTVYTIRSPIRGALLEINQKLLTNSQLLEQKTYTDGYLVILQPKPHEIAEIQASLLTKDEYHQFRALPSEITASLLQIPSPTIMEE